MDVVPDIEDVLDQLGIERYVSLGGSGGCPHSFACGALSRRCVAAAAIAAPTPYPPEGLDWFDGQGEQNQAEWAAALDGREALEAFIEGEAAEMRAATPEQIKEVMTYTDHSVRIMGCAAIREAMDACKIILRHGRNRTCGPGEMSCALCGR